MITRRRALAGIFAAPAIVRVASTMRVRTPPLVMTPRYIVHYDAVVFARLATFTIEGSNDDVNCTTLARAT